MWAWSLAFYLLLLKPFSPSSLEIGLKSIFYCLCRKSSHQMIKTQAKKKTKSSSLYLWILGIVHLSPWVTAENCHHLGAVRRCKFTIKFWSIMYLSLIDSLLLKWVPYAKEYERNATCTWENLSQFLSLETSNDIAWHPSEEASWEMVLLNVPSSAMSLSNVSSIFPFPIFIFFEF